MNLVFSLVISCFFMALAWQIYLRTQNHIAAEVLRPFSIFLVGASHLCFNGWSAKGNIAFYFLMFWGFRRSIFMLVTQKNDDKLKFFYHSLMKSWQINDQSVLMFYLIQGLYAWILALPFYFIAKQLSFSWLDMFIFSLIFIMFIFEFTADLNAYFFQKKNSPLPNQQGLWSLCRHPNYLCTWLIWLGFSSIGLYNFVSIISLLPCLFLFSIINFYLIPISEKFLLQRYPKSYAIYQKTVPAFFPSAKKLKSGF